MTFTNKAAAEMGERVEKITGGSSIAKPVISTFHSFCVRVLRRDIEALRIPSSVPGKPPIGHSKSFVIYDEADQQQVTAGKQGNQGLIDDFLLAINDLAYGAPRCAQLAAQPFDVGQGCSCVSVVCSRGVGGHQMLMLSGEYERWKPRIAPGTRA